MYESVIVKYLWGVAHVLVEFEGPRITFTGSVSQIAQDPSYFQQVPLPLSARRSWKYPNKTHQENIIAGPPRPISSPLKPRKRVEDREKNN